MSTPHPDIYNLLDLLYAPDDVVELRALKVPTGNDWTATVSGYFDDFDALAAEAAKLDRRGAEGVYVTLNPVLPELLARRRNRAARCRRGDPLTKDDEIVRRRWLLVDLDPCRASGISATDAEKQAAFERADAVFAFLKEQGFGEPVRADSGNGAHGLYYVDLPTDDTGLVRRVLQALGGRFSDDDVNVDTNVHNPSRLVKMYGTTVRKGDLTEERPHRRSQLLRIPTTIEPVPLSALQRLAVEVEPTLETYVFGAWPEEKIRSALAAIPPGPDYERWIRIIAAVLDATGGDVDLAAQLLQEWSPETPEKGGYRRKLESGFDGSITAGTLHFQASRQGWTPPEPRPDQRTHRAAEPTSDTSADPSAPIGVIVADVARERIDWLWKGRLALGEKTILDGDPGLGKSTMILDTAARITTGRALPGDGEPYAGPGGVVYVTGEDSIAHTIRPRLEAAGADLERVCVVQVVQDGKGGERSAWIPDDLPLLAEAVRRVEARLLVIDPLVAHLPPRINANRDKDVRSALTPLRDFAEAHGLAVLVVRHLNKDESKADLYRGGGSIGILAAFRIALLMGRDPEDANRLVIAHVKNNLAPPPPSLAFRLESAIDVARVAWEGEVDLSASDLLKGASQRARPTPERDAATAFLRAFLRDGPRPSQEVYDAAEEAGISERTLKRAKADLGVESGQIFEGSRTWFFVPPWWDPEKDATSSRGILSDGNHSLREKWAVWARHRDSSAAPPDTDERAPGPGEVASYPDPSDQTPKSPTTSASREDPPRENAPADKDATADGTLSEDSNPPSEAPGGGLEGVDAASADRVPPQAGMAGSSQAPSLASLPKDSLVETPDGLARLRQVHNKRTNVHLLSDPPEAKGTWYDTDEVTPADPNADRDRSGPI